MKFIFARVQSSLLFLRKWSRNSSNQRWFQHLKVCPPSELISFRIGLLESFQKWKGSHSHDHCFLFELSGHYTKWSASSNFRHCKLEHKNPVYLITLYQLLSIKVGMLSHSFFSLNSGFKNFLQIKYLMMTLFSWQVYTELSSPTNLLVQQTPCNFSASKKPSRITTKQNRILP